MFFTKDDYEKIYNYIKNNSIKDSEFDIAESLNEFDYVTIVQDDVNKKLRISDFIEMLYTIRSFDFINVSEQYDAYFISLQEAFRLIPFKARKTGLLITFIDSRKKWVVYQFQGVETQWNNPELWVSVNWEKNTISFDDLTDEQKESLKGEKGDTFTYDDLTDEQKEELKGKDGNDGNDGDKGDPFRYEDFTPEQLEKLRGPAGIKGKDGKDGYTPIKGVDYFDGNDGYTPIKGYDYFDGSPGEQGKDGTVSFDELSEEQRKSLKGDKGDVQLATFTIEDGYLYINTPDIDSSNIDFSINENGELQYEILI